MRKRNANIILSHINILQTFFLCYENITYFFVPEFFMLCDKIILAWNIHFYRTEEIHHRRVLPPKLARASRRSDRMLRSRGVHFRDLGQAATMRPFHAAISTKGHPGLDGSIVIKSIGPTYRWCSRMLHGLNSVSRNGADRSVRHQDALWSAREDMPADRRNAERPGYLAPICTIVLFTINQVSRN